MLNKNKFRLVMAVLLLGMFMTVSFAIPAYANTDLLDSIIGWDEDGNKESATNIYKDRFKGNEAVLRNMSVVDTALKWLITIVSYAAVVLVILRILKSILYFSSSGVFDSMRDNGVRGFKMFDLKSLAGIESRADGSPEGLWTNFVRTLPLYVGIMAFAMLGASGTLFNLYLNMAGGVAVPFEKMAQLDLAAEVDHWITSEAMHDFVYDDTIEGRFYESLANATFKEVVRLTGSKTNEEYSKIHRDISNMISELKSSSRGSYLGQSNVPTYYIPWQVEPPVGFDGRANILEKNDILRRAIDVSTYRTHSLDNLTIRDLFTESRLVLNDSNSLVYNVGRGNPYNYKSDGEVEYLIIYMRFNLAE